MSAAIYYHPEAYTTTGPKLMGRNAAGESFLRGYLAHSRADAFSVQVHELAHARQFAETAAAAGRPETVTAITHQSLGALTHAGTLYYPGPNLGSLAWQRSFYGASAWSLCGITHTTSSAGAMDALCELVTAPLQPWDALICTSTAVKDNVTRVLQAQVDYLGERLGIQRVVLPQLPIIPLGIHTQDFQQDEARRQHARHALNLGDQALVVLYMGRLSFHAKAHPLAMYQAIESAARQAGKQVTLIECGWHANEFITKAYRDAAQLACPGVQVITLDGRDPAQRQSAWAVADVFCSLSDNIQETFGITPIEAMAAGLPVVVSDWDGYKDTVRDGVDGFRIPTLMPAAGVGDDLAYRHALDLDTYDMYCGHTCSLVAVDIAAATVAFTQLFNSEALRRQMGTAGQMRARTLYDWSAIIAQYEALWAEMATLRHGAGEPRPQVWPARLDPFLGFAAYPSSSLAGDTRLMLVDADLEVARQRVQDYRQLAMVNFANVVLPTDAEVGAVLETAHQGAATAAALVATIAADRQVFVFRALAWLVKLGVLKTCA